MKFKSNNIFGILSTLLVASFMTVFTGCEKVEDSSNITPVKTEDQIVIDNIMNFLDKVEFERQGVTQKNNEFMSIDSAVWYIEAAINYTNTEPVSSPNVEVSFYTVEVPTEESNGIINMSEIQIIYDLFQSNIDNIIAVEEDINKIFIADVYLPETKSTATTFTMTIGVEKGLKTYFPVLHDWHWGLGLGRCDGSGLGVGTDAADIINSRINQVIVVPPASAFWTDVECFEMIGQNDGLFEYYETTSTTHCITSQAITNYIGVVETYITNHCPSGKQVSYRYFYDDVLPIMPGFEGLHRCDIRYGIIRYGIEII